MKFAFIVMYELRSIKKTIDNIQKYIIDYYNADVFIICQKQFIDDEENSKLFTKNVKITILYDKPDPIKYFGKNSNMCLPNGDGSWNTYGNSQIYINNNEVSKYIKQYVNDYDYFINIRIDSEILFDFPPIELFEKIPYSVYTLSPNYCQSWGGSGAGNFIHKNFIMDYLTSYNDILISDKYRNLIMSKLSDNFNQEKLLNLSLELKNIKMIHIKNINIYYTGESLNDYTTWSKFIVHPTHNVICKYIDQCSEAYESLNMWVNGKRWEYENNCVLLK